MHLAVLMTLITLNSRAAGNARAPCSPLLRCNLMLGFELPLCAQSRAEMERGVNELLARQQQQHWSAHALADAVCVSCSALSRLLATLHR